MYSVLKMTPSRSVNCETDHNCDPNVAHFQPIKTLTKLLQTFSNLLNIVISWKTGKYSGHGPQFAVRDLNGFP